MSKGERGYKFPYKEQRQERISDEKLGNLLAAVGNNEAKALTLLAMKPGIIYTQGDLHRRVLEIQGAQEGWGMNRRRPFFYCQQSLSPIGLVAHEVIDSDMNTYGYMVTDYGETQGKAFAALLLDFSQRHPETSLYDLFGSTASSSKPQDKTTENESIEFKKRSPLTRLNIFRELLSSQSLPIREVDLAKKMGEEQNIIFKHLTSLSERHIINYDSVEADQPISFYRLSPSHPDTLPPPKYNHPSLTYKVHQILSDDPIREWTREDIAERIMQDHPEKERLKYSLKKHVSRVLSHLRSQGYAEVRKFSHGIRSEITLSEPQRTMLSNLITLIDQFQNQDKAILERGKSLAVSLLSQPDKISTLFQKAKEHSPYLNQTPSEEFEASILGIVSRSPSTTIADIRSALEQEYGRKLGHTRIGALLISLNRQGKVHGEKVKTTIRWRIPSETTH